MKSLTIIVVLSLGILGACSGCAGSTPAPATPRPKDDVPSVPEAADSDAAGNAHSFDVGMDFKEKDDSEQRRASHDPPATGTWKPVEKDRTLDAKR
ncbi:MAG TPA: hypothetical protein VKP30_05995 [Polyangiaceae bacterium]|nr:hypothetical protein [Polyangiaceae bacterium]